MAQLVEHIVHIDGVTGSSPVATTESRKSLKIKDFLLFFLILQGVQNEPLYRIQILDVDRLVAQLVHIESM